MEFLSLSNAPSSPLSPVPSDAASDSDVSILSRSPSPPSDSDQSFAKRHTYISPPSSRRSSTKTSPAPEDMPSPSSTNGDDARPSKRTKLTDPKECTVERLDLCGADVDEDQKPQLRRLLNVLHKKRKIVVIAGAGISVSAGIPDFRSATGLFNSLKKEHKLKFSGKDLFDASVYQGDDSLSAFHDMIRTLSHDTKAAKPTAFHHLLATLAQEGRLMRLYTQNVDDIDTSLPPLSTQTPFPKKGPWPKTVQVHGSVHHMVCTKCHKVSPLDAEKFNGPSPPPCPTCVENDVVRQVAEKRSHGIGWLRPRMVLYNDGNPDDEAVGACALADLRSRPDAIIVVGTTLKVPGIRKIASELCRIVRDRKDGLSVWLNNEPEPLAKELEDVWDLVVKGPCDEVARHANMRRWDDPMDYKEVTDADVNKIKEKQRAEVIIGTPRKPVVLREAGHLTPGQSPRMRPQTMKQDPTTPSKRGIKRKLDPPMNLFGAVATKVPTKKAQPRKMAVGRSKQKKHTKKHTPGINAVFKATKSNTKPASKLQAKKADASTCPIKAELAAPTQLVPKENASDTFHIEKRQIPNTPRRPRLTKIKANYMAPLSETNSRNNQSPTRPEMESFTPLKPRTPSEQLLEEALSFAPSPTSGSRPSTGGSHKDETIRPLSVPKGMGGLFT
jgi:NAD-dependent histone deacetylase SIR2